MKSLFAVSFVVIFSAAALGQHRGRDGGQAPPVNSQSLRRFGGALPLVGPGYPAIGGALPIVNPFAGSVPFPQRLGATISGFPPFTGAPVGAGRRHGGRHHGGHGGSPLLYPVFGPLGVAYDQPGDMSGVPPDQAGYAQMAPNQNLAPQPQVEEEEQPSEERPRVQSYVAPSAPRPEPAADQPLFFIALNDSSVYTAVAYWVENGTLNYVTPQGKHNQVSLSLIDRETTMRLNQGSKFQIHLPAA